MVTNGRSRLSLGTFWALRFCFWFLLSLRLCFIPAHTATLQRWRQDAGYLLKLLFENKVKMSVSVEYATSHSNPWHTSQTCAHLIWCLPRPELVCVCFCLCVNWLIACCAHVSIGDLPSFSGSRCVYMCVCSPLLTVVEVNAGEGKTWYFYFWESVLAFFS